MVTVKCHMVFDEGVISPESLKDGQDITGQMANFSPRPRTATILDTNGTASGSSVVELFMELTFYDEDTAWEFYSSYVDGDYDGFESSLV